MLRRVLCGLWMTVLWVGLVSYDANADDNIDQESKPTSTIAIDMNAVVPNSQTKTMDGDEADNNQSATDSNKMKEITVDLYPCEEPSLNLKFYCNPEWDTDLVNGTLLMRISKEPNLTLTITRSDTPVLFMKQLTRESLQELGNYKSDFIMQAVMVAGQDAVQTIADAEGYSDIQLVDYYTIYDSSLYSFLFTVDPKSHFNYFKPLIAKIKDSVEFKKFDSPEM